MLRLLRRHLFHRFTSNFRNPATLVPATTAATPSHSLKHLCLPNVISFSSSSTTAGPAGAKEPSPFTVSFLESSCGLSSDAALSAAKKLKLKATKNPLSVLSLLKEFGFSDANIVTLITRTPDILNSKLVVLRPKLDFCRSLGLGPEVVSAYPWALNWSLEKRLLPNVELLQSILLNREDVMRTLKNRPTLLCCNLEKLLLPKIQALRDYNVAAPVITLLLIRHSRAFEQRSGRFEEAFKEVKRLSFRPSSSVFAHALGVLAVMPKRVWEEKLDDYRRLGWSPEQALKAFLGHPYCMRLTFDRLKKSMKFFKEELNWGPDYLSICPVALSLSLENRIIPRYEVWQILMSKGLLKGTLKANYFMISDNEFVRKYVIKYQARAAEVVDIVQSHMIGIKGLKAERTET